MTEQIFLLLTPRKLHHTDLLYDELALKMVSIRITPTSLLVHFTRKDQPRILPAQLIPKEYMEHMWAIELDPALMQGPLKQFASGPMMKMMDVSAMAQRLKAGRLRRKFRKIPERLVDRVLDRIGEVGMQGVHGAELRLLDRYAAQLRGTEGGTEHRP